ncbi:MAG: trehalose-phosphatase [Halanaerobiales bacterium]
MTEKLLQSKEVLAKIREEENILLFLDYDGTLAPFHDDPGQAVPLPEIPSLLEGLAVKRGYVVSLISGRSLEDLQSMITVEGANYAGSHGLEIELADGSTLDWAGEADLDFAVLEESKSWFRDTYAEKEGFRLEDKGLVVTFHLPAAESPDNLAVKLEKLAGSEFQTLKGRQIVEVRPRGWNKGRAVEYICDYLEDRMGLKDYLPLYIGDDTTDEDAFRVLEGWGICVYVRNGEKRPTVAGYHLGTPREVKKFLARLV